MKIEWGELCKDLKNVLLKHFRPEVGPEPAEVGLLKMVVSVQKQQRDLNNIRDELGESVRLLNASEILKEFSRLQQLAPSEGAEPVARSEDVMFG